MTAKTDILNTLAPLLEQFANGLVSLTTLRQQLDALEVLPPNFIDVKSLGATGDGVTDDTAALQRAIDVAANESKTCWFSAGTYMVDAEWMLKPRIGSLLQFHPDSLLKVIPNAAQKTNVFSCESVTDVWFIDGPRILGDRMQHDYSAPGTEEWGHGVKADKYCKRIFIRGFDIRQCHGDGLSISAEDVFLYRGISTQNRRQGLTVGSARHMRVIDCEFSETRALTIDGVTNEHTAPGAGIDIEPDTEDAHDILIEDCRIPNNATTGILMWMRSKVGKTITRVLLRNNTISDNANQIQASALAGKIEFEAYGNDISYTTGSGIRIESGVTAIIGGTDEASDERNFFVNSKMRTPTTLFGRSTATAADIRVLSNVSVPSNVTALWNNYA